MSDDGIARALDNARALELEPVLGAHARASREHLAGSDDERAADFNAALHDASIRGIFALRGGYGTMRILDRIDYAQLARDPKCVLGFSDLTAPLNALAQRSNVVTFHGPVASEPLTDGLHARVRDALFHHRFDVMRGDRTIGGGRARGVLRGGNLALIAALCGTPYAVETRDAIVLMEDVGEAPYRIDRLLTQLRLANALRHAAGFAIGDIPGPHVVEERLADLRLPTLGGLPVGHIDDNWILPIGAEVELDADAGTLTVT